MEMSEWIKYEGTHEQIAEMLNAENGIMTLKKCKHCRIVLEETEEDTDPLLYQPIKIDGLCVLMVMHNKIWRVVEEE